MNRRKLEIVEYVNLGYSSLLDFRQTDEFNVLAKKAEGRSTWRYLSHVFNAYSVNCLRRFRTELDYLDSDQTVDFLFDLLSSHGINPVRRVKGYWRDGIKGYTMPTSYGFDKKDGQLTEVVMAYRGGIPMKTPAELGFLVRVFQKQRDMGLYSGGIILNIFGPMDCLAPRFYPDEYNDSSLRLRLSVCLFKKHHIREVLGDVTRIR